MEVNEKIIETNKKLVERYPFLLPRNVFDDELDEDYNYESTWYDCIDEGWQIGFGEILLEDLRKALIETDYIDEFRFMQIKEKYGSLRIYCNAVPRKVRDVLHKYEFISQCVCIECGSPHACVVNCYGWYLPLCKDCWNKLSKKREEKGYTPISYEEAGGESCELPDSYTVTTFFKGEDKEIVYDISETTNKIKEAYEKRKNKC